MIGYLASCRNCHCVATRPDDWVASNLDMRIIGIARDGLVDSKRRGQAARPGGKVSPVLR